MKFKTIAEAFNHYRTAKIEDIERRANEIKNIIETDASADVDALNIELGGLKQAKDNIQANTVIQRSEFNPIEGMEIRNAGLSVEAAEGDVFASPEYRTAFFKTLLGRNLTAAETTAYNRACEIMVAEKRADAFSTSTNSAAVLPTQTLNEIISKARTMGGLLSVCRGFNLPEKLAVPVATPSASAKWHTEGAKVDSEKPTVVNVYFDGYEIIKIFSISAKVRRMSIQAFESYLIDELYACVMATVESALVKGTGDNQGTGLDKCTWTKDLNAIEYAKGGKPKYTDFVATMAMLKRGYSAGAHWAMNNATLYTHVYSIVDDNKRPIFIADPKQEQIGHILGKPVVIDDNIENGDIYLGNFQYMAYNFVEAPVIEVSRESSFNKGLIDYRALAIADTKPIVEEAFIKMQEEKQ
jgi:HK97 family phage major capsid protein